ncbi:MAG: Threonylcarbamoyl-AMP synthase [Candidatus Ordinivivax streblomastigis]|uniref:L-threonylcarbamoyladenylate synthase n=1 Tax=Candidatus Ordinivivax streblomastigis TaxID=2540710 RepID=A0A5M8P0N5_9BACT|nr:MAG: Threonylcarbamoyl-AMP synthase [Candidatus Ordinivivax streblomastigis]
MEEELKKACQILKEGGVILYPTDTIWGIGCDATNEAAVRRIYEIKQRTDSKSILVLLDSTAKLDYYVDEAPDIALDIIELSEKPLTIIYSGAKNVASNLIASDGSLGIRITKEPFSRQLCQRLRHPLVSTSANISGQPAPANFSEISDEIIRSVDYVVNFRKDDNQKTIPSSIIQLGKGGLVKIIRE